MRLGRVLAPCLAFGLCVLAPASPAHAAPAAPRPWVTPAEAADFEATPSYDETIAFLKKLASRLPLKLEFYGTSGQGRPMPVAILSADRAFTPEAAAKTGRPVLLIVSGIHAGEIDGKDATLVLLRDLAFGKRPELLRAATILFVPIFNVDGHERVSPYNRPNQDGPRRGMGFRTNAAGLDLNRDHLKADSPEMKALIGLFNRWRPDLHVDNHVTDGCEFQWTLTYGVAEAPEAAPSIDAWVKAHLPAALEATQKAGFGTGPYVDLVDGRDPSKGFESFVAGGRFSTGYFTLRNRVSILVEMHSYKPYRERVLGNLAFLEGLIAEIGRDPKSLTDAVRTAERRTIELGKKDAPPSDLALGWTQGKKPDHVLFPVYAYTNVVSTVTGKPIARYERGKVAPIDVPWFHETVPVATTPRPRGYVVLPGWPQVEQRLRVHGLRVLRVTEPADVEVVALRASKPAFDTPSYQGHVSVKASLDAETGTRTIPAGALWIPADQPDFEVAAELLDPQSPESLFAWGLLDGSMEQKEYIDTRVLEGVVQEMLKDPKAAAEWEKALADPEFAKDSGARYRWWYRRTPYWDRDTGLVPVFRVMKEPGFRVTGWK